MDGLIFPFAEYMDRFQGQTQFYGSKPMDFHMAIEEAIMVENGFTDSAFDAGQESYPVTNHSGIQEVTSSNHDVGYCSPKKVGYDKDTRPCDSCDLIRPCKTMKKIKGKTSKVQYLCDHCAKLRKLKQYCGVCKKIWHHLDGGDRPRYQTRYTLSALAWKGFIIQLFICKL